LRSLATLFVTFVKLLFEFRAFSVLQVEVVLCGTVAALAAEAGGAVAASPFRFGST